MDSFARSRMIAGGVQVEMNTEVARELAALIHSQLGTCSEGLQNVAKTLDNTLVITGLDDATGSVGP